MCRFFSFFLVVCLISLNGLQANGVQSVQLTKNGIACFTIITSADASQCEIFAANELKNTLIELTQTDFQLSTKLQDRSIVVTTKKSLTAFTQNDIIAELKADSYSIFVKDNCIYLVGESPRSTLYAVYDFLEQLGCTWVAPDYEFYAGKSKKIPFKKELTYTFDDVKIEKPAFFYRKFYVEEARSHDLESLKKIIDWMPKARMNVIVFPIDYEGRGEIKWDMWREELIPEINKRNIIIEVGGHGYQNFIHAAIDGGTLFEKNPTWFGMETTGERTTNPKMVFCTSNQCATNFFYQNILNYLNNRPEINIFDFWPPDSEKWCSCEKCLELGTETARHILLVNHVASKLQQDLPGLKLECLSYNRYTKPTDEIKLNENVLLDFCPIAQNFEHQIYDKGNERNESYHQDLLKWLTVFEGDISIYSYFRKYAWRSLPNIITGYMQNDMKYYYSLGIKGISVYSEPGDWFTYGVNHYVFTKLAWNPFVSTDSLTWIYTDVVYDKAGSVAYHIYKELEDIVRFACNIAHSVIKTPAVYEAYQQRITRCRQILSAEMDKLSDVVIHEHSKRLDLMLAYASKSITFMIAKAQNNTELTKKNDMEIRLFLREHAGKGIFIPHRYM